MRFFYTSTLTLLTAIFINGCNAPTAQQQTIELEHIQKSKELESMMLKFDNLVFVQFQSELERDDKRIDYTKNMASLLDELVWNSHQLQKTKYSSSSEFLRLAKALESESKALERIVAEYRTEEISPKFKDITHICNQCHATLR